LMLLLLLLFIIIIIIARCWIFEDDVVVMRVFLRVCEPNFVTFLYVTKPYIFILRC